MRLAGLFLMCASAVLAQREPVTLDAMDQAGRLTPQGRGNPAAWSPDGTKFVYRQGRTLAIYDAAKMSSKDLASTADMDSAAARTSAPDPEPFGWENRRVREAPIQWPTEKQILYSSGGDVFLINVDTGKWKQLTKTPVAERDPKLSPDGKALVFRRDWDLYALDVASGRETRLTTGGSDTLRNGGLDWVYPEELDLGTAYWWSPDSKSIAYLQFDTSREPLYPHEDLRGAKAIYEPERYPQAGDNNPDVRLGIVAAAGGATRWIDLGDLGDTRNDHLIPRVGWMPDSKALYAIRTNRVQNRLELLSIGADSGKVSRILEESDRYWINLLGEPRFIEGGKQFLWLSERDGFRHIYLYSSEGKLVLQLTNGPWEVASISGVDETAGRVYYTSSEPSPLERHMYSIGLNGQDKRQLTSGSGTHTINMSPSAAYYLETFSNVSSPPQTTLHASDGRELGVYREADRRVVDGFDLLPVELVNFKDANGTLFYARLIRPAGFDPQKKYPAIVQVYGGPGAQGIRNSWSGVDLDQVYAHQGFVVWQMDNRGSTGRGHAFETPIYHNLGPIELADQIAGVEYLVSLGFVDRARIGIYGWSYGGFMTLNALLNAPDVFRSGIAGAPVTDWRNYDTIYTERYMGLPKDNRDGYKNTALPQRAKNLKGKLMIAHNLEDDNVLFQNSLQMIDSLEQAGKQFELGLYTQKTHGVGGAADRQLNAARLDFFERNLK